MSSHRGGKPPPEYKLLYKALTTDERSVLHTTLPLDGKVDIPDSFRQSIYLYVALHKDKANALQVSLDLPFIEYIMAFMDGEIDRFYTREKQGAGEGAN